MQPLERRIDAAARLAARFGGRLACPLCAGALGVEGHSLVCGARHTYDISAKGYVNLFGARSKVSDLYGRALFEARRAVSEAGLYDGLVEAVAGALRDYGIREGSLVIDAGCGGGWITQALRGQTGGLLAGIDLAKEGVALASQYPGILWAVANINALPFASGSADAVINVMSPANYAEFRRVLKPEGVLVKVIPGAGYLRELRRYLYGGKDKGEYSNAEVGAHAGESMPVLEKRRVLYTYSIEGARLRAALYDMTPLTADAPPDTRERFIGEGGPFTVTVEAEALIMRN